MNALESDIYPVTICATRYSGTYEGNIYAAFYADPYDIPYDAFGSDLECLEWWYENGKGVGIGNTPDAALKALIRIPEEERWIAPSSWIAAMRELEKDT